ncbi:3-coathanger stack domain-containing protein [Jiulongibacter sediminis]|uniref:Uncharacterized protein n=1 Tax=Jiulongibacter sediminis TaxID=1605367 RepID=A0A0P7BZT7_9BACT|nr:3-coathanger stack domain-containing protein [Jiulongibacter sediminis]KPM47775.1 hypothetical protein AFM12_10935 [Jiulongibacter sediminis]TBX23959.1 hypothetical protein TK44_10940 [Jiulongibacter sediminis]
MPTTKWIIGIVFFLTILSRPVFSQAVSDGILKVFGGSSTEHVFDAIFDSERNCFFIVGSTSSTDGIFEGHASGTKMFLIKTDTLFEVEWVQTMPGYSRTSNIAEFGSEELAIAGHSDTSLKIFTLNKDTGVIVNERFESRASSIFQTSKLRLVSTSNKTLILFRNVRKTFNKGVGVIGSELSGLAFDQNLSFKWERQYGGGLGSNIYDVFSNNDGTVTFWAYTESTDGDVVGSKNLQSNESEDDIWMVRINENSGQIQNSRIIGGAGEDEIYGVSRADDEGYILACRIDGRDEQLFTATGNYILKLNKLGNVIWERPQQGYLPSSNQISSVNDDFLYYTNSGLYLMSSNGALLESFLIAKFNPFNSVKFINQGGGNYAIVELYDYYGISYPSGDIRVKTFKIEQGSLQLKDISPSWLCSKRPIQIEFSSNTPINPDNRFQISLVSGYEEYYLGETSGYTFNFNAPVLSSPNVNSTKEFRVKIKSTSPENEIIAGVIRVQSPLKWEGNASLELDNPTQGYLGSSITLPANGPFKLFVNQESFSTSFSNNINFVQKYLEKPSILYLDKVQNLCGTFPIENSVRFNIQKDTLEIEEQLNLGGSMEDELGDLILTNSGEYIIAINSKSSNGELSGNSGRSDILIIKLNNDLDVLWKYEIHGESSDEVFDLKEAQNGDILFVGTTFSTNLNGVYGGLAGRLSATGTLKWLKTYTTPHDNGYYVENIPDQFSQLQELGNGDILIAGLIESRVGIKRVNSNGVEILHETYTNRGAKVYNLEKYGQGNFILGFTSREAFPGSRGFDDIGLLNISETGDSISFFNIGGNYDDVLHSVKVNNGEIFLHGYTESTNGDFSLNPGGGKSMFVGKYSPEIGLSSTSYIRNAPDSYYDGIHDMLIDSDKVIVTSRSCCGSEVRAPFHFGSRWYNLIVSCYDLGLNLNWQKVIQSEEIGNSASRILSLSSGKYFVSTDVVGPNADIKSTKGLTDVWLGVLSHEPKCQTFDSPINDSIITNEFYKSEVVINFQGDIIPGNEVIFQSGREVILSPGATIDKGSVFKAIIDGCQ